MPQKGQSPISRFALSQFRRTFDDLISVQAFITPFNRSLLENIFEMIMWFDRTKDDYEIFEGMARVAYQKVASCLLTWLSTRKVRAQRKMERLKRMRSYFVLIRTSQGAIGDTGSMILVLMGNGYTAQVQAI